MHFLQYDQGEERRFEFYLHSQKNMFFCSEYLSVYNGHSLVIPNRHVNDLSKLKGEERNEIFDLIDETKGLLDKVLKPQGFNIGMNIGKISGAGFPGHLHVHIVPRWKGDVNFMPAVANTKVISQSLKELYRQLKKGK